VPRIYDRTTGATLGHLSDEELAELIELMRLPVNDEAPYPIDPDALDRIADAGASSALMFAIRQIMEGRESIDIGWDGAA
jgi:hypothetical protein